MMDEEEITWNLKGPKRMKKRRELNALIRNNVKYKSLLGKGGGHQHRDEFSMMTCSNGGSSSGGRLLKGLNYTSTEEDDEKNYYFSGNKSTIKEYVMGRLFI